MDVSPAQLKYLHLLAQQYPTIQAASTEIINLSAKLNLPKGTEHFISDIHGEYEAFVHVLRNSVFSERMQRAYEYFVKDGHYFHFEIELQKAYLNLGEVCLEFAIDVQVFKVH